MSVTLNPFGTHVESGEYLDDTHGEPYAAGAERGTFVVGDGYLIHAASHGHSDEAHDEAHAVPMADDGHSNETEFIQRRYVTTDGQQGRQEFGPKAFGALFFFITGFHGFHVFSGVLFLIIIMLNAASGLYAKRKNGYEMVEKIGLYWHFVDLVWVFVFLVFYLV